MNKLKDLTGVSFGKLKVIGHSHVTKTKYNSSVHHWKCKCECGNTISVRGDCLTRGITKSCGCLRNREGKDSKTWKGYKDISATVWKQIKWSAKSRKILFDLTMPQLWRLYLKQNKKCSLSGIPLTFPRNALDTSANVSLDRIDSTKGYTIDNVQWVDKRINFMKITLKMEEFIDLCRQIVAYDNFKRET
jgi:hypothetical protein